MHDSATRESSAEHGSGRIILVGNPNVGKSAIFGVLTGKYVIVSNYPGTTVEVTQGNAVINKKKTLIIDTPGVNSLVPMSEDEQVTRDILLEENPDAVVQVADAKNLERGLCISTQLAELEIPFILTLNMFDEARSRGIAIDLQRLSDILGISVVPTIATQRTGIDKLTGSLTNARIPRFMVSFDQDIEDTVEEIVGILSGIDKGKRGIALMLLSGDETLGSWLRSKVSDEDITKIEHIRQSLQQKYQQPLGYVIAIQRLKAVEALASKVVAKTTALKDAAPSGRKSISPIIGIPLLVLVTLGLHYLTGLNEWWAILGLPVLLLTLYLFGDWGMHPLFGIPVLGVVLYVTWLFVGAFGAGVMVDFFESTVFGEWINPLAQKATNAVVPWAIVRDLLTGEYGIFTMALTYAFAIVFPIVGAFFLAFGLLEDSGYLPRLAIMVNRIFKVMGLNGKAVLPMILGLGCDTMATLTARILDTKRERVIVTLLLALGIPCSAQLGVIMGMLGGVNMPMLAASIWLGVVIFVIFKVGYLASKVIPGEGSDFILEVPPIRMPQVGNIAVKTLARVEWYVREAVPLFILGTLVLFLLDALHMLSGIQSAAAPVVQDWLGLPPNATEAFVIGFLRRDYGVAGLFTLAKQGLLDPTQIVVSLVTITLFIPCIANFFVIIKERGIWTAIAISAFIVPYAFFMGGLVNLALRGLNIL